MTGDIDLRRKLDHAMASKSQSEYNERWLTVAAHPRHRVKAINGGVGARDRVNCIAYALRMEREEGYDKLVDDYGSGAIAQTSFMEWLVEIGEVTIIKSDKFIRTNVILYYDSDKLTHAARVEVDNTLLTSKWGSNEVYEHGLWEVPLSYGNAYKVATVPNRENATQLLCQWVADHTES